MALRQATKNLATIGQSINSRWLAGGSQVLRAGHEDERPWEHATHMYNLAEVRADIE